MAARRLLTPLPALALLAAGALAPLGCRSARTDDGLETVVIRDHTFHLEVAADDATRTHGLMERDEIAEDGGMIFIFPDSEVRSFWMKDCLVDIDLIFLDPRGRVTATHRMKALPPRGPDESESAYETRMQRTESWSGLPAQFAIELKAGWLDRLDLAVEDQIELDLPRLKAMAR